jgi:2-polyprenyl-3-methyl-5-hydroxy-6-metoxy-1,4-benzoquinol methylase
MSNSANNSFAIPTEPCELCGSNSARHLFTAKDRLRISDVSFRVVQCESCGVWRTLPEMSEAELAKFYPNDYWGGEPTREWIQASQSDKTDFVIRCQLAGGRILDVGCGAGFFLRALNEKRWQAYGVELGEEAAKAAAEVFGKEKIFQGTLSEAKFAEAFFDVITFWSALEHTNEPRANLAEARRILKPSGTLIVQVPNAASYQARYFKGDWFSLDAPRHRYHFDLQTLQKVLQETGFAIYRYTFHSKVHNSHALRQSLKTQLWHRSLPKRAAFLLSIPFLEPFDYFMASLHKGATMTVAARAV